MPGRPTRCHKDQCRRRRTVTVRRSVLSAKPRHGSTSSPSHTETISSFEQSLLVLACKRPNLQAQASASRITIYTWSTKATMACYIRSVVRRAPHMAVEMRRVCTMLCAGKPGGRGSEWTPISSRQSLTSVIM